jgi:hypothetical protein
MTEIETGKPKEFRKSFKKYDLVIDSGKIFTVVIFLIVLTAFTFFMLYLAGVF